ncbi:tRNA lysidine(34) synthetase TilS [Pseudochelatococcus contaminans]|uniref:tRNA(Ile)-lysidine synthase n=1 Tax=Pseudochelatococcus contaminans TaxID=1538103 RepID=A0A7W5Z2S0_9HYPH|nr:tRNA lysidine(34) synthetase TilS [Pseudochelatococcus contaminans]MBB3809050.1 tRNA(Ile)-lysidine synthase [Pseudochelatococcus contaminans]
MTEFCNNTPLLTRDPRLLPFDSIADSEIEELFALLADAPKLVLAVSGGPDSVALMLLAARWSALRGTPAVVVASVDHGLRPSAAGEARAVVALAQWLGFEGRVLTWQGNKPRSGIQEAARAARYRLLADAAYADGASHVVTAHHRDDQAETVLMRLSGGSGIGGLSAMRPVAEMPETRIRLARPLLGLPKRRLIAITDEAGVQVVDDPANRDPRFARARLRGHEAERSVLGLTPERLTRLAARAARAEDALSTIAAGHYSTLVQDDRGHLTVSSDVWREPEEIVLRVLALALMQVTGVNRPVALERLERLGGEMHAARRAGAALRRTLHGATVRLSSAGKIDIAPEPPRLRGRAGRGAGPIGDE